MDYDFTDAQGNTLQGTMGDKMSIILLPRAKEEPGTAPGTNQLEPITRYLNANYPQYTWIKGHMWNQEIGGPGETKNLVPLTSDANMAHSNNAERPIKNALIGFDSYYDRNKGVKTVYGFHYTVEVEKDFWSNVPGNIIRVPNSIHVQATPIEYNPKDGTYRPIAIDTILVAIDRMLHDQVKKLNRGIWVDQSGKVTPASVAP